MKSSITLTAAALALFAGCGTQSTDREATDTSDTLQSNGDAAVPMPMTGTVGPPPPPPTEEEIQKAAECQQLQTEARTEFENARETVEIDQCGTDKDCNPFWNQVDVAFVVESDACWGSCAGIVGTKEYIDVLQDIAADLCSEPRAKECPVHHPSCPVSNAVPPTWACVDGECVQEQ